MPAFDQHIGDEEQVRLGNFTVTIRQLALMDLFRLARMVDLVKDDLGLTRADLEGMEFSAAGLANLLERILKACVGTMDLDTDTPELTKPAAIVCREIGKLLDVPSEAVLYAPLNDLTLAAEKFWEVNASGPLGQKIRGTIGAWRPRLQALMDIAMLNLQQELIRGPRAGGTSNGGTITSLPLSTESSTGPSGTSSESFPPGESSLSSPPSATSPATNPPSSAEPEKAESPVPEASTP